MSIQLKAVQQAIALLAASGAVYAIRLDGQDYGNGKLEEAKKVPSRSVKYHWQKLYIEWLKNVKPGDSFKHSLASKEEAGSLQGALSGQLSHYYGKKSYITSTTKVNDVWVVEALFIGPTNA